MSDSDLKKFLNHHISSYCHGNPRNISPKLVFIPIDENYDISQLIGNILTADQAKEWLVFNTTGSFHHQNEKLFPILQLIREILFIDDNLLTINAKLSDHERLPQIGKYLIPEFLQSIPNIEQLYKLIAEVSTEEEKEWILSNRNGTQLVDGLNNIPLRIQNSSKLYATILHVFNRVIKELFEVKGMIFIYNHLHKSDLNSLNWLEYSACGTLTESVPLFIIACYPEDLHPDFLDSWPKSAKYVQFIRSEPVHFIDLSSSKEISKESISDIEGKEVKKYSDAELIVRGVRKIYEHLIKNGIIPQ
ncbi:hypothetical protein NEF87_004367 [Candidatus Lokiarchaeum ossiferum]|uniref:Uncharacterized protein n=1 Tax=Candidatus Lokiarchaeum ossiferum TaxID=2951803 RepID=A0ABY6I0G9_9ARCH|nr:hypothetical protein NEF87_004367 [Candidatus Lokiarchaeum sp. B-35]